MAEDVLSSECRRKAGLRISEDASLGDLPDSVQTVLSKEFTLVSTAHLCVHMPLTLPLHSPVQCTLGAGQDFPSKEFTSRRVTHESVYARRRLPPVGI